MESFLSKFHRHRKRDGSIFFSCKRSSTALFHISLAVYFASAFVPETIMSQTRSCWRHSLIKCQPETCAYHSRASEPQIPSARIWTGQTKNSENLEMKNMRIISSEQSLLNLATEHCFLSLFVHAGVFSMICLLTPCSSSTRWQLLHYLLKYTGYD